MSFLRLIWKRVSDLLVPLEQLVSLHEVLVLQLLLVQLVLLLQVALFQLPHGRFSGYTHTQSYKPSSESGAVCDAGSK